MPYSPQTWHDEPTEDTPISAARLGVIESALAAMGAYGPDFSTANELPIWNGSAWTHAKISDANVAAAAAIAYSKLALTGNIVNADIAAAAAIAISKLAGYPSDGTKVLKGDGTWGAAAGSIALSAALPGSPSDGDKIILVDSTSAPTYAWLLQYVSAKGSNKWQFLGGSPLEAEVATQETTASTTYAALTTGGPSVTLPVAGDYIVEIGFNGDTNTSGDGAYMSFDIGATGASDNDRVGFLKNPGSGAGTPNAQASYTRSMKKTGLTAVTLTSKYRAVTGGTALFQLRWIKATPIAIGG